MPWRSRLANAVSIPARIVGNTMSVVPSAAAALVAREKPQLATGAYVAASVAERVAVGAALGSLAGPVGIAAGVASGIMSAVTNRCSGQLQQVMGAVKKGGTVASSTRAGVKAGGDLYADYTRGVTLGVVDGAKGIVNAWRDKPTAPAGRSISGTVASAVGAAAMTLPGLAYGFLHAGADEKRSTQVMFGAMAAGAGLAVLGLPGILVGGGAAAALCVASHQMQGGRVAEAVESAVDETSASTPRPDRPVEAVWKERVQGALVGAGAAARVGATQARAYMGQLMDAALTHADL